ncbi:MAG: sigma-54-dependent Fis family transcriptional regulator [Chitinispirillaceae bacterium]|nr:sigma-54-dependent Fis family transcriptional regulator [Chitinispirillaceae bacterium]
MEMQIDFPENPILIVDDEEDVLASYKMTLQCNGITNIVLCSDPRQVNTLMTRHEPSLVILDLFMPFIKGEQILDEINRDYPGTLVIVITGSVNVDTAVTCMKTGAFDYMVKPVEKSRLLYGVRNAIESSLMHNQVSILEQNMMRCLEVQNPEHFKSLITVSERMEAIFRYIESVAPSPMPVLILGESGTGKELIARAIHDASGRKGNYVTVNAAGIGGSLSIDTLFGHKKGAFTGADTKRAGLIEQAAGGTLFLDEIGDIDTHTQLSLLRLLQQKEYYPLGSDIPKTSDARIIAATNVDLTEKMDSGEFRKDFYYRIATHSIEVPPLRDRPEDIPVLTGYFIGHAQSVLNKNVISIPKELFTLLGAYHFPGNVRELQSLIFDVVSQHNSDTLDVDVFREYIRNNCGQIPISVIDDSKDDFIISIEKRFPTMQEIEEICIKRALEITNGNQSSAAMLLGISQPTLSRRMKKYSDKTSLVFA